jgi:hypothetical protein
VLHAVPVLTQTNAGHTMLRKTAPTGIPIKRLLSLGQVAEFNQRFCAMDLKLKQLCANFGCVEIFLQKKKCFIPYLIIYKIFDALMNWKYGKKAMQPACHMTRKRIRHYT